MKQIDNSPRAEPASNSDAGSRPDSDAGSRPDSDSSPAPRARPAGPSLRPALVVVGIAVGLVLVFGIGSALTGSGTPPRTPTAGKAGAAGGTSLEATPGVRALRPIELPGTPPADVLDALVVPTGSRAVAVTRWNGSTQFNGVIAFSLHVSQAAIVAFYRSELRANGWSNFSVGAAHDQRGATEVLAQRASTDGWYWEVGVVVSPTTFGSGSNAATETTRFSLDLFEVPDDQ